MVVVKRCPKCASNKINLFAGAITGQYNCKKCGYVGVIIIEEDLKEFEKKEKGDKSGT
tara:strand:- start:2545 stop:2718 length:174 start_codon:yes stop_codon:yes gene_type:complete